MKELTRPFPTVECFGGGTPGHLAQNTPYVDAGFAAYLAIFCGSFACESHVSVTKPKLICQPLYATGLHSPSPETDSLWARARSGATNAVWE